jgi:predicted PurR-regulated permease PerM
MTDARRASLGRPALYALIVLGLYLSYLVLGPFLAALTWAVVFAILFQRMQVALSRRVGAGRAALVTTLVVTAVIVAPAIVLISALAHEAPQIVDYLKRASQSAPYQIQRLWSAARAVSPLSMPEDPTDLLTEGVQRALTFLAPHAGAFVADSFATLGSLVVMLFALFFMLRDGDAMSRRLRDLLPFTEHESEQLLSDTRDLVIASVGAGVAVAAAQGIVGGLAFRLVGIGAPAFWGVAMGFSSLLPVVGASLVWAPAGAWLLLSGEIWRGVILLLIGVFGISMIDNVLRPLVLSGRTSINGLVVFLGLLGGAAAFGFVGVVIGPIILVTTARLLNSLRHPELLDEPGSRPDEVVAAGGNQDRR